EGTQLLLQAGTVDRHFAGVVDQVVQQVGAHAHLLLRCARSGGVRGDRGRFLVLHRRRQRRQGLGGGGQLDRLGSHRLRCGGDRLCGDGWLRLLDGGGGHRGGGLRLDRGGRRVQGRNGFAADTGLERRDQRVRHGRGAVGTGLHQQLVQGVEATLQQLDVVAVQVGAVFGGGFQQ